jgi:hypothetical protein
MMRMLARVLVPLLILAIQACPLYCRAPVNQSGTGGSAAGCCCSHCAGDIVHDSRSDHGPARPVPGMPSQSGGQCICCGAVVERQAPFEVHVERSSLDVDANVAVSVPAATSGHAVAAASVLTYRTTPGRLVCCLNKSFLL